MYTYKVPRGLKWFPLRSTISRSQDICNVSFPVEHNVKFQSFFFLEGQSQGRLDFE